MEAFYWISWPFISLCELWVGGSNQLFWFKPLSKLTDSLASHWIALLGLAWTMAICSNLLGSYSRASSASADLYWMAWTQKMKSSPLYSAYCTDSWVTEFPTEKQAPLHRTQLTKQNWLEVIELHVSLFWVLELKVCLYSSQITQI